MTGRFANIIVDISHEKVDRPFQYLVPDRLRDTLEVGMAVRIPFGRGNKLIQGYVIELTDKAEYDVSRLKEIDSIVEGGVSAQADSIRLAYWLREHYGSTMIAALKTVLPVKKKMKQPVKKTVLCRASSDEAYRKSVIFEAKHQMAKARLMRELSRTGKLPYTLVTGKLNIPASTIRSLTEAGLIETVQESVYRNPLLKSDISGKSAEPRQLSDQQQAVVDTVFEDFCHGVTQTYLLRGITGSGKTEVYMSLIERMISIGKQAIVLIPEIALTYQTLLRFYLRFGDRVSVMNSRLSLGERSDQYERAARGEIDIMIGPRSALFTPFERLGLVIIDEEHESSYKSETMPKFHAREVAGELCRMKKASLLLGSATPSLESYYRAKQGEIPLFTLDKRLTGGTLPQVYIEDLREELKNGNRSIFSRRLQALLEDRLKKGQQSILFLNRRGYAGFVSCRSCGHVMKCPHCDVSLSEHKNGMLVCHYCGYETPHVTKCPKCGSKYILGFRAGTQQIEELLGRMYPHARVLRMDADTTKTKDSYEDILSRFANEEADILVGTQMIVKGHDFPKVTLVGILAADMSLHTADYRAAERTFQLLTQAAGRAGRGSLAGEVVIQTYQPQHYAVVHAAAQDYEGFYEEEIAYRDMMSYPPMANMLAVLVLSADEMTGVSHAMELADLVKNRLAEDRIQVIGPAAASIGRIQDIYRNIFYMKHKDYEVLVQAKNLMEAYIAQKEWSTDTVQFDFNPMTGY